MADFAQFVVFGPDPAKEDETFILPDPDSDDPSRCFTRTLVNLDETRTAVVMFNVKPEGRPLLEMSFTFNDDNDENEDKKFENEDKKFEFVHQFDGSDSKSVRTFHKVLPPGCLSKTSGNKLCVESGKIHGQPRGTLEISDIVLFYHGKR